MTSKIIVNNIEADAGVSTVTFNSKVASSEFVGNVTGNLTGDATGLSGSPTLSGITSVSTTNLTVNGNAYPATGPLSNRNLIINGAMQVAQRGTSFAGLTAASYVIDRFDLYITTGTFSAEQSTTAPSGFGNSLKVDCTATTSLGTSGAVVLRQKFEGLNAQSIKKGTSDAQPITLSFWARSNKTGTYISEIYDATNNRQVSKSYTINSADTWEYKTLTFPADTTGTLNNTNAQSIIAQFWLAAGTNFTSGTLNTTWNSVTTANRIVGQVDFGDSTSNEFYITGVQLEVGSVATPFEHRSYGDELARCQRYYAVLGTSAQPSPCPVFSRASNTKVMGIDLPVPMRTTPTVGTAGNVRILRGGSFADSNSSMTIDSVTPTIYLGGSMTRLSIWWSSNLTSVTNSANEVYGGFSGGMAFSAEL